jgi:hypothetical protein
MTFTASAGVSVFASHFSHPRREPLERGDAFDCGRALDDR